MLFNSIEFLIFLPIIFLIYWLLLKKLSHRNTLLLVASYVFYAWWDYRFLLLIISMTAFGWVSGLLLERFDNFKRIRKLILWTMIILSMGTLVAFKYFDFFSHEFCKILNLAGLGVDAITLNLILPVGISFYTFQVLSYVIDVYRGDMKPVRQALPFFVFISFFPQLVAGPIERAGNLIPQFTRNREFRYEMGSSGMKLILWGLFKKIVIADNAAVYVNMIFANPSEAGTLNLWIGAILFTFQIYGDFSGYSDIAIGTARLFGIKLMRNFNLPYFSRDIAEFWRRWHISLTSWLRDYVYIPLGGNRKGKSKALRNTMVVFLTSGIWHGANLTFIVWGAYHALLFLPLSILNIHHRNSNEYHRASLSWKFSAMVLSMGITFLLVMIGWVIFRADNLEVAWQYITLMFSHLTPSNPVLGKSTLLWILLLVAAEWHGRDKETPISLQAHGIFKVASMRWAFYISLYLICLFCGGSHSDFIYFKF